MRLMKTMRPIVTSTGTVSYAAMVDVGCCSRKWTTSQSLYIYTVVILRGHISEGDYFYGSPILCQPYFYAGHILHHQRSDQFLCNGII